ncbi:MAG: cupin domain-containing protein [Proteobacteria bacterium]|nr:cupin domain-containing protein [Pseudomonadota bacterium]
MKHVKQIDLQDNFWKDARGWGVKPFGAINLPHGFAGNPHIVSLKPGVVRGNHYHTNSTEWIFVFGGKARIVWKTRMERSAQQVVVTDSEPALFEIPPDVAHAVVNDSENDIYLVVFYDSLEADTVFEKLVNDS